MTMDGGGYAYVGFSSIWAAVDALTIAALQRDRAHRL